MTRSEGMISKGVFMQDGFKVNIDCAWGVYVYIYVMNRSFQCGHLYRNHVCQWGQSMHDHLQ